MFLLQTHIERERAHNRKLAWIGCIAGNWLKLGISPTKLQDLQDAIRQEMLAVEQRLRVIRARQQRREKRLGPVESFSGEFKRKRSEYIDLLRQRERVLWTRRAILKQCGDACAWAVLRVDPRLILPLFSSTRTHELSSGIGLAGPIQIMMTAHASAEFLVVENDLTRCLGIGDLTLVRADGRWARPLPVEVKTHGQFIEGAEVEIEVISAYSDHPVDQEMYNAFVRLMDFRERENPCTSPRIDRQAREIQDSTELLHRLTRTKKEQMPFAERTLWPAMDNILAKAQVAGYSYDVVENGVVFVAIRNRSGDDSIAATRRVLKLLDEVGHGREKAYGSVTSHEFQTIDQFAAIAPPIPLWPINGAIRTELLTGELFFACVIDPLVWSRAFEDEGLEWTEREGHWVIGRSGEIATLDPVEVRKLTVGVAFAGFSPKEVAATAARGLVSGRLRNAPRDAP